MNTLPRYVELISYKVFAELKEEISRHFVGALWWILDPILFMSVFYIVFNVLPFKDRPENFVAFLLVGLVSWRWFQHGVTSTANSIFANRSIARLVYVPKVIFVLCSLLSSMVKFLIVLFLLILFLYFSGYLPSLQYAWLLPLIAVQFILIGAVSFPLAAVIPAIPDAVFLVQHGLRLAFFVSGIFFDGRQIAEEHQRYFYLNPMASVLEGYRDIMLYGATPDLVKLGYVLAGSLLFLLVGISIVVRMDRRFPKMLASR